MTRGLHRAGELHFITCSCYHRMPLFRFARSRDRFLSVLEQTRKRYRRVPHSFAYFADEWVLSSSDMCGDHRNHSVLAATLSE